MSLLAGAEGPAELSLVNVKVLKDAEDKDIAVEPVSVGVEGRPWWLRFEDE